MFKDRKSKLGNNRTLLGFPLIKKYKHTLEQIFLIQKEDTFLRFRSLREKCRMLH